MEIYVSGGILFALFSALVGVIYNLINKKIDGLDKKLDKIALKEELRKVENDLTRDNDKQDKEIKELRDKLEAIKQVQDRCTSCKSGL